MSSPGRTGAALKIVASAVDSHRMPPLPAAAARSARAWWCLLLVGPVALPLAATPTATASMTTSLAVTSTATSMATPTATPTAGCGSAPGLLRNSPLQSWRPRGGVLVRAWKGRNHLGLPIQLTVAQADLSRARPAVSTAPGYGAAASTTSITARSTGALVGVNGDYFDYDWDGRAVPVGPQVRRGVIQRLPASPARFVGLDSTGALRAGTVRAHGTVRLGAADGDPIRLPVRSVNPTSVPRAGVSVITPYMGAQRPRASWEVVVRSGRAVWTGRRAPFGRGRAYGDRSRSASAGDRLVVATGPAVPALRAVRRGDPVAVTVTARSQDGARVVEALGRGGHLLVNGRAVVTCRGAGTWSRARTVVAWNERTGLMWLLVADSGGAASPNGMWGLTYRQAALLAAQLGARQAVLLDGGGSSTLAVRMPGRPVVRVDSPRRTVQRPVPNGLVLVRSSP